jgi:hypothetical protein
MLRSTSTVASSAPSRSPARIRFLWPVTGCLALAALSLLAPSAPTTDPWGWIVWGREVLHLDLSTIVPGAPSWKPLPVLVTTPLALAAGAAPWLWLWLARAAGLAALVVGFKLAERLAGRAAGVVAVVALAPGTLWVHSMAHGYSEPLAMGLVLGAVLAELSGKPRLALLLGSLAALTRPEAWCLVVVYGVLLWRRRQMHPLALAGVVLAVPLLWLVPDWLGSGDPLHASKVSRLVVPTGTQAAWAALGEGALMTPPPLIATALIGSVLAWKRGDRRLASIGALALAWAALLAALMFSGYPADGRFFIHPTALLTVMGAAGAAVMVRAIPGRRRLALAALLVLALAPFLVERSADSVKEARNSVGVARLEADLHSALTAAGPIRHCDRPMIPTGMSWLKGAVAWQAHLPLHKVRTRSTSAAGFLRTLPKQPSLRLSNSDTVTVWPHRTRFVMVLPFGNAHIEIAHHLRLRVRTAAAAGPWRVVVPAAARGCSTS